MLHIYRVFHLMGGGVIGTVIYRLGQIRIYPISLSVHSSTCQYSLYLKGKLILRANSTGWNRSGFTWSVCESV